MTEFAAAVQGAFQISGDQQGLHQRIVSCRTKRSEVRHLHTTYGEIPPAEELRGPSASALVLLFLGMTKRVGNATQDSEMQPYIASGLSQRIAQPR
jgi:hypothetical protein